MKRLNPLGLLQKRRDKQSTTENTTRPPIHFVALIGWLIIIVFIGGFGLWSSLSPLESAAIAPGSITVASNRKTIQHLEGGIVEKIYVRDGQKVKKGDPLIELDETQSTARLDILRARSNALLAQQARLNAEKKNQKIITFPKDLLDQKQEPTIAQLLQSQQTLLDTRLKTHQSTIDVLHNRIKQSEEEIESLRSQMESSTDQLKWIEEETVAVRYLEEKKLIERPRLLALLREKARLEGDRDENKALISRTEQKIGESKLEIIRFKSRWRQDMLQELRSATDELSDILERQKALEDVVKRTIVKAPEAGTVMGLRIHTVGGVINPGDAIMDIVPSQDQLVIRARLNPLDIDVVKQGMIAKVTLTPYKQRHIPQLEGSVTRVSADSYEDPNSHEMYYRARIVIPAKELKRIADLKLHPGMPVQVMIITDKRTPLEYFMTPITDSFKRAFKEQ